MIVRSQRSNDPTTCDDTTHNSGVGAWRISPVPGLPVLLVRHVVLQHLFRAVERGEVRVAITTYREERECWLVRLPVLVD